MYCFILIQIFKFKKPIKLFFNKNLNHGQVPGTGLKSLNFFPTLIKNNSKYLSTGMEHAFLRKFTKVDVILRNLT
jgi:hypothetical protein